MNSLQSMAEETRFMLEKLASDYTSAFLVDLKTKDYVIIKTVPTFKKLMEKNAGKVHFDNFADFAVQDIHLQQVKDATQIQNVLHDLSTGDESANIMFLSKFGNREWCNAKWVVAERDEQGNPTKAFFLVKDIDPEKKKQEDMLAQMSEAINSAGLGIWKTELIAGQHPRMIGSAKLREILGLSPDRSYTNEQVYDEWRTRICPEAEEEVHEAVEKMLSGQKVEITYKWNHPTRGVRYVRCGGTGYTVPGYGNILHGYHADVTEQVMTDLRQKEQLQQHIEANKSKTMFLQNMTHEIRTPINAMFGFSQMLCMPDGTLTEEEKAEYFTYINNSFNMLTLLIDDVLDLADSTHGNYRIVNESVNVNDVCRTSMQMAEIRVQSGVQLKFTTEVADDYTIQSDGRRIQQVLINYLTNACKHTWKGEIHLHCSTEENPGRLTFSVTDTGEGIPADMAGDIFERFKKLNYNVQGSGLGLNICNMIADKLNGEVKLDTTYTNGARFLFIL